MGDVYRLDVNGVERDVEDAAPTASLLQVLRERLGLLGTQGACEEGECGSCSVLVDGVVVCSCLVFANAVVGKRIVTVEGLTATAAASDVQDAMIAAGAVQCGFCTPGLVVAIYGLLGTAPEPSEPDIREALSGNLCRCTGYGRIVDAVQRVVDGRRLSRAAETNR